MSLSQTKNIFKTRQKHTYPIILLFIEALITQRKNYMLWKLEPNDKIISCEFERKMSNTFTLHMTCKCNEKYIDMCTLKT